jgi:oligoribonuclease
MECQAAGRLYYQAMTNTLNSQHLLWLDFEMTGLDAAKDKIVEVAMIVTDWDFNEIAQYHSGFGYDSAELETLLSANPFYAKMKENKTELLALSAASPAAEVVEKEMVAFIREHCGALQPVVLCGNSIHMDRQFIRAQLPHVEQLLHYRMLDVTAWKLVFEAKYNKKYLKQETHRALDDVRESIGELKYYLESVA